MSNGKTIRQIADEIGVTRQAIYKKFKLNSAVSDSLKAHSFTVDKVKYYTAEGEKIIKSMFADNNDTPKGTVNLSTKQLTDKLAHDNLTTNQVDRLSDELTGSQDNKTPKKSAFSANNTFKGTVNLSTEQLTDKLTHDNLTTSQVDRLTDLFSAQLTAKDKQIEEKDKEYYDKIFNEYKTAFLKKFKNDWDDESIREHLKQELEFAYEFKADFFNELNDDDLILGNLYEFTEFCSMNIERLL